MSGWKDEQHDGFGPGSRAELMQQLRADGYTMKQIADTFSLSPMRVHQILDKLSVLKRWQKL